MTKARNPQLGKSKSGDKTTRNPTGKNATRKLPRQQSSLEDLTYFMQQIDEEFTRNNQLVKIKEEQKYNILSGKERSNPNKRIKTNKLQFKHQVEIEEKLGSASKGMLLLSTITTDWDVQEVELKKLLQLVKENIPKSIGIKSSKGRALFDTAHAWVGRNSRAKTWRLIQNAAWETSQEFKETEECGRKLIMKIKQLLKPKKKEEANVNGMSWEACLSEKPPKWDKNDNY